MFSALRPMLTPHLEPLCASILEGCGGPLCVMRGHYSPAPHKPISVAPNRFSYSLLLIFTQGCSNRYNFMSALTPVLGLRSNNLRVRASGGWQAKIQYPVRRVCKIDLRVFADKEFEGDRDVQRTALAKC